MWLHINPSMLEDLLEFQCMIRPVHRQYACVHFCLKPSHLLVCTVLCYAMYYSTSSFWVVVLSVHPHSTPFPLTCRNENERHVQNHLVKMTLKVHANLHHVKEYFSSPCSNCVLYFKAFIFILFFCKPGIRRHVQEISHRQH